VLLRLPPERIPVIPVRPSRYDGRDFDVSLSATRTKRKPS